MTSNSDQKPAAHPDDQGTASCRIEPRQSGEVAWITLEHAGKVNALGTAMIDALMKIFAELQDREALRVVVVTGAGSRAFVGGAFVPELYSLDAEGARNFIFRLHLLYQALRQCPVPVIARIRGYCLGAGTDLAAACDFRVAERSAVFGMPEVRVGMPSLIEAALLPMLIGWGKTREMLMTGAHYGATEGKEMGFFEVVCDEGEIDAAVEKKIEQILAGGPQAIRAQKALINAWEELKPSEGIMLGVDLIARAYENGEPHRMMAPLMNRKKG
jgi:enoyl-CoA hydratase/carnithine racemase